MAKPPVKARQLAGELEERIRSGDWKPGDWLPPERQLAETHNAGRSTVRQAVEMLATAGLVEPVAGSGARVRAASTTPVVLDAAAVQARLDAIHAELANMGKRLEAVEHRLSEL